MPEQSPLPFIPTWSNLRVYILGLLWICLLSCGPIVAFLYYDIKRNEHTDWDKLETIALTTVGGAALSYWRKHSALISPPPGTDAAKVTTTLLEQPGRQPITTTETEKVVIIPKDTEPK